jgi:proteasome accessory factor B
VAKQSPAQRLFTLTCCLLAAPKLGLSKQEIFNSVQAYVDTSSDAREKMFDRDKTILREMGVGLEVLDFDSYEETEASRYRIAKGSFEWPKDLVLNSEKLQLLELAARAWNNRIMSPSAQSGLTRLKTLGVMPGSRELAMFTPRLIARHQSFDPLAKAISQQFSVGFRYRKADGEASLKTVDPLKLRFLEGQWVLLASDSGVLKNYLLRRIVSEVSTFGAFENNTSPDDLALAELELQQHVMSQTAVIEVATDSEAWWHFAVNDSGLAKLNFMDEALLAEDLMEFGSDVKVLEPESLAARMRLGFERVVNSHA